MQEFASALFGAVVGVVTAFGVQLLQQRSADRHRFSEKRAERYAAFLRGLDEQGRAIRYQRSVIGGLGRVPTTLDSLPEIPRPEPLKLLAHEIKLLASRHSDVGAAVDAGLDALQALRRYRFDGSTPAPHLHDANSLDGYDSAVTALNLAMSRFTDAARRDLGPD
jgi:hypothetical protein